MIDQMHACVQEILWEVSKMPAVAIFMEDGFGVALRATLKGYSAWSSKSNNLISLLWW